MYGHTKVGWGRSRRLSWPDDARQRLKRKAKKRGDREDPGQRGRAGAGEASCLARRAAADNLVPAIARWQRRRFQSAALQPPPLSPCHAPSHAPHPACHMRQVWARWRLAHGQRRRRDGRRADRAGREKQGRAVQMSGRGRKRKRVRPTASPDPRSPILPLSQSCSLHRSLLPLPPSSSSCPCTRSTDSVRSKGNLRKTRPHDFARDSEAPVCSSKSKCV